MRVLVTGARGFVGRNLCCALKNIRDGKDRREKYQALLPLEVMEYDIDSTPGELDDCCSRADFVFNLAGVNRRLGRAATDDFLKRCSAVIDQCAAQHAQGIAARLNGADFAVMLPGETAGTAITEQLLDWVNEASAGIAFDPDNLKLTSVHASGTTGLLQIGADAQQIVVGRRSLGRVTRWFVGSLSSSLAESAKVPVTVVRIDMNPP
mgnify:CR=1 FL=1